MPNEIFEKKNSNQFLENLLEQSLGDYSKNLLKKLVKVIWNVKTVCGISGIIIKGFLDNVHCWDAWQYTNERGTPEEIHGRIQIGKI